METLKHRVIQFPARIARVVARRRAPPATLIVSLLLWGGISDSPAGAASSVRLAVIANSGVPVHSLSAGEIASVFTRAMRNWKDGSLIRPLNLSPGTAERVEFDRVVLRMEPEQSAQFWVDRIVRGEETAPKAIAKQEILLRLVETTSGAIGYVADDKVSSTVRVLARISDGKVVSP